ncbi:amidohydrolase family protein [bacterium]|nr:amidohydrolase family protein [bacterium]
MTPSYYNFSPDAAKLRVVKTVRIQHPSDSTGLHFQERVYEASLRDIGDSWFAIDDLRELDLAPESNMPILHKGYFETHAHSVWCCQRRNCVDLSQAKGVDEVLNLLLEAQPGDDGIIRAFDWDESRINVDLESFIRAVSRRMPNHYPILAARTCGHSAIVNQSFKELFSRESMPSFIVEKQYFDLLESIPAPLKLDALKKTYKTFQQELIAMGISTLSEMSMTDTDIGLFESLCEEGALLLDVMGVLDERHAQKTIARGPFEICNRMALGPMEKRASFSVRHWKRYLDGSLGSKTAWLKSPYSDGGGSGLAQYEFSELLEAAKVALQKGFHLSFHSIGDASTDQVIKLGKVLESPMMSRVKNDGSTKLPKTLHRIEHAQVLRDDQIDEIARQGFWSICAQPCHRIDDDSFILSRLGKNRMSKLAYRAGGILQQKVPCLMGTDAPISLWDPMRNIQAAVTHPNERERFSFSQAVWFYTTGARMLLGMDAGVLDPSSSVFLTFEK